MIVVYVRLNIVLLILLIVGCSSKVEKTEFPQQFDSKIQLTLINEWKIQSPDVIPNPRFMGVLRDTSLIIIDRSLNTINHFDRDGILISIFGGIGRGPGEFSDITHAVIHPDGKVAVADNNNARLIIINLYEDSQITSQLDIGWHTRLHWVSDQLVISNNPFKMGGTNPGDIFMRVFDPETGEKNPFYHMELDWSDAPREGQISCTFCEHRFMDDLRFFTSPQDTSYQIFRVSPLINETILFARSGSPAVKYSEQERIVLQNQYRNAQQVTGLNASMDNIPTHKRRFIDFFPDQKGRLWALINPPEESVPYFDLFSPDADYIGSVKVSEEVKSVQFIHDNYILVEYESADPDVWEGALYKILDG